MYANGKPTFDYVAKLSAERDQASQMKQYVYYFSPSRDSCRLLGFGDEVSAPTADRVPDIQIE